ncbi:MAG: indole-3-glycerol phosphate synthase TrpC [Alphaproteobacteria bacterium]|nr:MAG: indole-3-glycerol phosphate synthase TrpC [Alphaproteobacteria bacterium]
MSDVLAEICARKRAEVAAARTQLSLSDLEKRAQEAEAVRGFRAALAERRARGDLAVIAEFKRRSPSAGAIREQADPAAIARAYAAAGAACLSVLTDQSYFGGGPADLAAARAACDLPVLRKDFLVDPWQVVEARAMGADAVLVIMAAVTDSLAEELIAAARQWGMDVLVEVHDAGELDRAMGLRVPIDLIGINNRDLKRMVVDLETSLTLAPRLPAGVLAVAESGLKSHADLRRCQQAGIGCFLIGESLMRAADPGAALAELLGEGS